MTSTSQPTRPTALPSEPGALPAVADAARMLDGADDAEWWRLTDRDLRALLGWTGLLRHRLAMVEAHVMSQVIDRGVAEHHGMRPADYLLRATSDRAPANTPACALATVRVAEAMAQVADDGGGRREDGSASPGALEPLLDVTRAFTSGALSVSKAAAIARFHQDAAPDADPETLREIMGVITAKAVDRPEPANQRSMDPLGPGEPDLRARCRGFTERQISVLTRRGLQLVRAPEAGQHDEERGRRGRTLHSLPWSHGMTEYRLVVESEAAAVIDAALSALSAPQPDEDGRPDPRGAPRRRADAMIMLIQRAVTAPGAVPRADKAQVMLTVDWRELRDEVRGAGVTMTGQVLSPSTVRRIACDASIIPAVLGARGQVLDLGRTVRLFTPAQVRALWHRDQGCTYPGCTIPAQWTQAHHIVHWARGGATDLSNAALLCARHHTHVHSRDLSATVDDHGVTWHT